MRLFKTGTRLAMKALQTIFGSDFLDSLGKFLNDLEGMQAGFRSRHLEVLNMLKAPSSSFFLTTFPSEARWEDSQRLAQVLKEESIPLRGVFMNRVEIEPGPEPTASTTPGLAAPALAELHQLWSFQSRELANQDQWRKRYSNLGSEFILAVPRRSEPIHDVASLSELGKLLVS